jgi:hypothetical protein
MTAPTAGHQVAFIHADGLRCGARARRLETFNLPADSSVHRDVTATRPTRKED